MKTLGLIALAAGLMATPALAQDFYVDNGYGYGSNDLTFNGPNAKMPSRRVPAWIPAYQRGSGQETGGYARELIPSDGFVEPYPADRIYVEPAPAYGAYGYFDD